MAGRGIRSLAVFGGLTIGAAALGGIATGSAVDTWYRGLKKPGFTPPAWVFGPAWTILYAAMAVAGWLVWRRRDAAPDAVRDATTLFGAQLALNTLWSVLFFGLRKPFLALVEIGALWTAIALWLRASFRVDRRAGLLIVPYLAWVSFAAALNLGIGLRNR